MGNFLHKIKRGYLLALLSAVALLFVISCRKNISSETEINDALIEKLKAILIKNGEKFSNGKLFIINNSKVEETLNLDWKSIKIIKGKYNSFYSINYCSENASSKRLLNDTSAYYSYTLLLQESTLNGNVEIRMLQNVNNLHIQGLNQYSKAASFSKTNGIQTRSFLFNKYDKSKKEIFFEDNQTRSIQKNLKTSSCIAISIPIRQTVCYSDGGPYNNSVCGLGIVGFNHYNICSSPQPDVVQDFFDIEDFIGGGGPIWTDSSNETPNQSIIDSLSGYPCAQSTLGEMLAVSKEVDSILNKVFGISSDVSVTFSVNSFLNDTIVGQAKIANGSLSNFNTLIELNPKYLTGSKDYIAATILHETVHAYIYYMRRYYESDTTTFKTLFPIYWAFRGNEAQHNQMANNYVQYIKGVLLALNSNLTPETAEALAWEGLSMTDVWKAKPELLKNQIRNINNSACNPTAGTADSLKIRRCN